MTLDELVKRQQQELDSLNSAKDKSWQEMRKRHHTLIESFGGYDNLYDDYKTGMQREIEAFHQEWHTETGRHHKAAKERHERERDNLSKGIPIDSPASLSKNKDKSYWQKRQALINGMKAGLERSKSKNRDRGRGM